MAFDLPSFSDIKKNFDDAKLEWATRGRLHVVNVVRDDFLSGQSLGRRTGTLVRSVQSESTVLSTGDGFVIGTNLDYGVAWELGFHRKEYIITAKNAKALAFEINGQTVFAKSVKIPAKDFAARPFLRPGLDASLDYLQELGDDLMGTAILKSFPDTLDIIVGGLG